MDRNFRFENSTNVQYALSDVREIAGNGDYYVGTTLYALTRKGDDKQAYDEPQMQ